MKGAAPLEASTFSYDYTGASPPIAITSTPPRHPDTDICHPAAKQASLDLDADSQELATSQALPEAPDLPPPVPHVRLDSLKEKTAGEPTALASPKFAQNPPPSSECDPPELAREASTSFEGDSLARDGSNTVSTAACAACGTVRPRCQFSANQLKKPLAQQRCKVCVAQTERV